MSNFKKELQDLTQRSKITKEIADKESYESMIKFIKQQFQSRAKKGESSISFRFRKNNSNKFFLQSGEEDSVECKDLETLVELISQQCEMKPTNGQVKRSNLDQVVYNPDLGSNGKSWTLTYSW